jgi:hypothetical protein
VLRDLYHDTARRSARFKATVFCLWVVFKYGRLVEIIEESVFDMAREFGVDKDAAGRYLDEGVDLGILVMIRESAALGDHRGRTPAWYKLSARGRTDLKSTLAETIGVRVSGLD